jgi:hypothetical protein
MSVVWATPPIPARAYRSFGTAPGTADSGVTGAGSTRVEPSRDSFLTLGSLMISVREEDGEWLAVEHVTSMFGEGDDPDEAFDDLVHSLRELRGHLTRDDGRLMPGLQEQLEVLRASPV